MTGYWNPAEVFSGIWVTPGILGVQFEAGSITRLCYEEKTDSTCLSVQATTGSANEHLQSLQHNWCMDCMDSFANPPSSYFFLIIPTEKKLFIMW